jgi:hypothetical protein
MLIFAGWVNRSQQDIIEYLQEENRVVPHQNLICGGIGGRRPVATHLASAAR